MDDSQHVNLTSTVNFTSLHFKIQCCTWGALENHGFLNGSLEQVSTATLKRLCLVNDASDDDENELSLTISFYFSCVRKVFEKNMSNEEVVSLMSVKLNLLQFGYRSLWGVGG